MAPASEEEMSRSARPNSRYGTALPSSAAIPRCRHSRPPAGSRWWRLTPATASSTTAPRTSRPRVSWVGAKPRRAILIQRKLLPQIDASSTRRSMLAGRIGGAQSSIGSR